ncbi:hypothetical protein PVAP13_1KG372000 [Panicum virgatum]|uniref:NET domain-containing protein n=1 Tax=Panicum virgatum TaxID=38727 RepID=A0A8T0XKV9_PANVG|nr:hypothetical protein PVAP13_1KG372000 [Panicum virgatum]
MPSDPALDLLRKRMASELEALRELVKKAELISRRPACKSGAGAAPAGRRKRILAAEPRPEPRVVEVGGKMMQSVKRRKMSASLDQKQKQMEAPRMSPDERERLAGRLASLAAVPGHIVEFLQQQFGGDAADPQGEIEIDVHKVEDSVLFELKTRLDKFAEESLVADAGSLPKEEHGSAMMDLDPKTTQMGSNLAEVIRSDAIPGQDEGDVDICGVSGSDSGSSSSSSDSSDGSSSGSDDSDSESDSDEAVSGRASPAVLLPEENGTSAPPPPPDPAPEASRSTKPESVPGNGADSAAPPALLLPEVVGPAQLPSHPAPEVAETAEQTEVRGALQRAAPKAVCLAGAIFRAKVRRELMEMERAVQPDESIHPGVLRRLCIAEYGRPGIMRQLGLFLKADA